MNTPPNDGGPAFPSPDFAVPIDLREDKILKLANMEGMSLRDWFAGQEQLGDYDHPDSGLSNQNCEHLAGRPKPPYTWNSTNPEEIKALLDFEADWRAALRLIRADAMLRALQKL